MNTSAFRPLLLLIVFLASCRPTATRTVVVSNPSIQEHEPNNSAFQPDSIGPVGLGSYFQIEGSIDEFAAPSSLDEYDGFAFYVKDAVEIEFVLHAHNPFADLDLWIYDPYNNDYIARFESSASPEYGRVTFPYLGEEFHVVVTSYSGDSQYSLEVIAHPLYGAFSSAAQATEEPSTEKSSKRMEGYRKPKRRSAPATLIQVDRHSGLIRTSPGIVEAAQ